MKKESSFKMKGFSGFGIDMTLNDNLNKAVRGKKVQLGRLKPGPLSEMTKKGKEINYKNFSNKMSYKADQARKMKDSLNKKPASFATKAFRGFKSLAKGLGSRATGVAGMMMGTMGTADANPAMRGKVKSYDRKTNTYK